MNNIERSPEHVIVQVTQPERPPWRAWPMVPGGAVPESYEREYVRADLHRGVVEALQAAFDELTTTAYDGRDSTVKILAHALGMEGEQ
jgi:hypothetical protein